MARSIMQLHCSKHAVTLGEMKSGAVDHLSRLPHATKPKHQTKTRSSQARRLPTDTYRLRHPVVATLNLDAKLPMPLLDCIAPPTFPVVCMWILLLHHSLLPALIKSTYLLVCVCAIHHRFTRSGRKSRRHSFSLFPNSPGVVGYRSTRALSSRWPHLARYHSPAAFCHFCHV